MRVIATAGHVDHGKSTLIRALTGTDPDRWAEEHRRGLTIDLGYAWTTIDDPDADGAAVHRDDADRDDAGDDGETFAFVDVPGHQRFIANMLAGLGPAPGVLFVVAADEGWRRQGTEHFAAIRALDIRHGVVAITRADLADPAPAASEVRRRFAGTPLADAEIVACSSVTGEGLPELRGALVRLAAVLPAPTTSGRVRMWLDRAFTMKGHGTVVTGTLESGRVVIGDAVRLVGPHHPVAAGRAQSAREGRAEHPSSAAGGREVTIRGIQSLGRPRDEATAVARVAVNLRGIASDDLARGDALLTGTWHLTTCVDVRVNTSDSDPGVGERHGNRMPADDSEAGRWPALDDRPGPEGTDSVAARGERTVLEPSHEGSDGWGRPPSMAAGSSGLRAGLPEQLVAHVGTAAMQVRVRPLGDARAGVARLTWQHALPLQAGDRMVLRDPGRQQVLAGAQVLDADPPPLIRRGDARRRAEALAAYDGRLDVAVEVGRRGWMRIADLLALGATAESLDAAVVSGSTRWIDTATGAASRFGDARLRSDATMAVTSGSGDARVRSDTAVTERTTADDADGITHHRGVRSSLTVSRGILVAPERWASWRDALRDEVRRASAADPLQSRVRADATASRIGAPPGTVTSAVLAALASDTGLELADGYLQMPGARADLGDAEPGLAEVERRLAEHPFAAPEKDDLSAFGLGRRELAAAVRLGRLIDLGDQVVLAPNAPALAMRTLAALDQPFTTSTARQALGTTRRVVLPLLAELDRRGWTRRVDDAHRVVVRATG